MKRRTKKVLSLLLAASMVFTMNTIAFGEEIVAEDVAADDAAVETVVEGAADADLADAEVADAELAAYEADGVNYEDEGKTKAVTTITFASNGEKKNAKENVATITNTTDPISWNNFYAADLMETVLSGGDNDAEYLNNDSKIGVSSNDGTKLSGLVGSDPAAVYESIEVDDGVYLFVKYAVGDYDEEGYDTQSAFVDGYSAFADDKFHPLYKIGAAGSNAKNDIDDANKVNGLISIIPQIGTPQSRVSKLPYTTWDGRKIAWNKSGFNNENKSSKEVLDVKVALVKYEGTTVTELYGANVSGVKIDTKLSKVASLTAATDQLKITGKYLDKDNKSYDANFYVAAHKIMNTLPNFKITVKAKGDAKQYGKMIKTQLNNLPFEFGIMQDSIVVTDPTTEKVTVDGVDGAFNYEYLRTTHPTDDYDINYHVKDAEVDDTDSTIGDASGFASRYKTTSSVFETASGNDAHNEEGTGVADLIAGDDSRALIDNSYMRGGYVGNVDLDSTEIDNLKVSKFKGDKGKATVTRIVPVFAKGVAKPAAEVALKAKTDYTFEKLSLAGEDVWTLEFPENGNYTYAYTAPVAATLGTCGTTDLSIFGFKYAFRKSPVEKSKQFRTGIASADNSGFVHSAE